MGKIKKVISNNKEELKVLAYGVVMMIGGLYIGKKYSNVEWNNMIINSANTGKDLYKVFGDEIYTLSVLKENFK